MAFWLFFAFRRRRRLRFLEGVAIGPEVSLRPPLEDDDDDIEGQGAMRETQHPQRLVGGLASGIGYGRLAADSQPALVGDGSPDEEGWFHVNSSQSGGGSGSEQQHDLASSVGHAPGSEGQWSTHGQSSHGHSSPQHPTGLQAAGVWQQQPQISPPTMSVLGPSRAEYVPAGVRPLSVALDGVGAASAAPRSPTMDPKRLSVRAGLPPSAWYSGKDEDVGYAEGESPSQEYLSSHGHPSSHGHGSGGGGSSSHGHSGPGESSRGHSSGTPSSGGHGGRLLSSPSSAGHAPSSPATDPSLYSHGSASPDSFWRGSFWRARGKRGAPSPTPPEHGPLHIPRQATSQSLPSPEPQRPQYVGTRAPASDPPLRRPSSLLRPSAPGTIPDFPYPALPRDPATLPEFPSPAITEVSVNAPDGLLDPGLGMRLLGGQVSTGSIGLRDHEDYSRPIRGVSLCCVL